MEINKPTEIVKNFTNFPCSVARQFLDSCGFCQRPKIKSGSLLASIEMGAPVFCIVKNN